MPKYRMLAKGEDNNITLHPETTADNVLMSESDNTTVFEKFEEYATKEKGVYYVEGTGTTAGKWLGSHDEITSYFDGLTVLYKTNIAGVSGGTTLDINGLGAKSIYRVGTTKLTTQYAANSVIMLAYMADLNSGSWMVLGDYDADVKVRSYVTTGDVEYPILTRYATTTGSNYYAEYARYALGITLNPSKGTITASTFNGSLDGNATSANDAQNVSDTIRGVDVYDIFETDDADQITPIVSKAACDAEGNDIITTYLDKRGGTLTGDIKLDELVAIRTSNDDGSIVYYGPPNTLNFGNSSDSLQLYGTQISLYATTYLEISKLKSLTAPTTSGGTTFGKGSSGQVLKTNGSTVYWGNDNHLYEYHIFCGGTDSPQGYLTFKILSNSASYLSTGSLTVSYLSTVASKLYNLGHTSPRTSLGANGEFMDIDNYTFEHIFGVYSPNGTNFYVCDNYDGYDFNYHSISVEQVEITRRQIF